MIRDYLKLLCLCCICLFLSACTPSVSEIRQELSSEQEIKTEPLTVLNTSVLPMRGPCYYTTFESQSRVLALKELDEPPYKTSYIKGAKERVLDPNSKHYQLIIFDIFTQSEIPLNYYIFEKPGIPIEESYAKLGIQYEDQHAKFLSNWYACVVPLNSMSKDAIIYKLELQSMVYHQGGTTESPNTIQLHDSYGSQLLFDIEKRSFTSVTDDEADEVLSKQPLFTSQYNFMPSEVPKEDRIYYNEICSDNKLSDFYFDMSLQDVINTLGEPITSYWISGGCHVEFPDFSFVCSIGESLINQQGEIKDTLTTTSDLIYRGPEAVIGLKNGMGLQDIMDVLGYIPNITITYESELWTNYFQLVQGPFTVLFALDGQCKIYEMEIRMNDDYSPPENNKIGIETFKDQRDEVNFPFDSFVTEEIFLDISGVLYFNADGFYYFEYGMMTPQKLSDQPMLFLFRDLFSTRRNVIALGKNDHFFYQLFLDDSTLKKLTTKPLDFN